MKKRNSATAALTASRWKKISKRKRRKKSPVHRLPKAARRHPSAFLRLLPLSPSPRRPPQAAEEAAASPARKRRRPKSLRRKKQRRSLGKRRLLRKPRRKKRRSVPRKKLRKKRGKKARDAVKSELGLEPLQLSKAAHSGARLFILSKWTRLPP